MWTTEIEDCLSKLTKEEKRVLKRTILKGNFGSDSCSLETFLAIFQSKKLDAGCI